LKKCEAEINFPKPFCFPYHKPKLLPLEDRLHAVYHTALFGTMELTDFTETLIFQTLDFFTIAILRSAKCDLSGFGAFAS